MFKIPQSELIAIIKEKSGLTDSEIDSRIQQKMKQLAGLISKEGAAHIIANELGIKILDKFSGKLQIKNILSGMRNVETVGRILKLYEIREFITQDRAGKVASFVLGDSTGTMRVVLWGDQADLIRALNENMIVKILGGYVRDNKGILEIHMNERSKIIQNPPGEEVGTIRFEVSRKKISELNEKDTNVELMGTIVRVFEPRFFEVCSECGKRARLRDGAFFCEEHNKVEPKYSFVLNLFLDDGSDNIRTVFFGDHALKVINKNASQIMQYKDNPEKFEDVKTELLGNIIKLVGRVNKNEMFDRLEFITQSVDINPNPDEEIKKLDEEIQKVTND